MIYLDQNVAAALARLVEAKRTNADQETLQRKWEELEAAKERWRKSSPRGEDKKEAKRDKRV